MKWSLPLVADWCGGTAHGDAEITSVSIDSRSIDPGALFVAVRGESDDGHRYLDDAIRAGAAAVVTERGRRGCHPGVEVVDPLVALSSLAAVRRAELSCPVVGVTGSSGKTTTKDFIGSVLGEGTHRSPASYNNEFGVPLTVLGAPDDCRALVVEVGSRGRGHIAALVPAFRPTVGVITMIGRAHLEMFEDLDGVRDAKWELIAGLEPDGVAVLPAEETELIARAGGPVVTFGVQPGSDVAVDACVLDEQGRAHFELHHRDETASVRMPIPGLHQARNAAAAVAAAIVVGERFVDAADRLESATIAPWRMELVPVVVPGGEVAVVNDAYNANPDSTRAALETVSAMPGRRRVAVLGKMFELGEQETATHREMGSLAASLGFVVIAVGDDPGIAAGAGEGAVSVPDADAAVQHLRATIRPGDIVLVKASRAAGLETIPARLGGDAS